MKVTLLSIGKTTNKNLANLIGEYEKRLKRYTTFQIVELPEIKNASSLSETLIMEKESTCLERYIESSDSVVLLDRGGNTFTSVAFADFIEQKQLGSTKHIKFIVGGAYGFPKIFQKKYAEQISLSPMTFTHQMVRLIFCEQLYRSYTILHNEPYHHQ